MPLTETQKLAKKLGVAESTIRARRSRGASLDTARQIRLTDRQKLQVAKARGDADEVAQKYGCSASTVRRLRRLYQDGELAAAAPAAKASKKKATKKKVAKKKAAKKKAAKKATKKKASKKKATKKKASKKKASSRRSKKK